MRKKNHRKSAFSLVEMSIVLLIVAIVVSGMLTISTVAVTNEKTRLTKERIDEIYKALGRYMLLNYRLPCPASLTKAKNTASYGVTVDAVGGNCSGTGVYTTSSGTLSTLSVYGAVPVATLGLPDEFAEDAFGSKFAYIVHKYYTKAEYPSATSANGFSYTSGGATMPATISMPSAAVNDAAAFVIISFGPNKLGAFNASATTQNGLTGASLSELQNMLTNISGSSATFGENSSYNASITFTMSDATSTVFDDIVFAKKRNDMVADFDAMFLVPCLASGITPSGVGYTDSYFGKIQYNSSACSAPNGDITPSVECTAFGTWITKQSCP